MELYVIYWSDWDLCRMENSLCVLWSCLFYKHRQKKWLKLLLWR